MTGQAPVCRRTEDIAALSGSRVCVVGQYLEQDLRQHPEPPPEFDGRAGIRLADGALILLEPSWSEAGIRPAEERRQLAGKQVEAVGTLHEEPIEPPTPVAFIHYPSLSPVESVGEPS